MLKKIIVEKLLDYLETYIEENKQELLDKGLEYVNQLIGIIRAKLLGEETFAAEDEMTAGFIEGADEIIDSCAE